MCARTERASNRASSCRAVSWASATREVSPFRRVALQGLEPRLGGLQGLKRLPVGEVVGLVSRFRDRGGAEQPLVAFDDRLAMGRLVFQLVDFGRGPRAFLDQLQSLRARVEGRARKLRILEPHEKRAARDSLAVLHENRGDDRSFRRAELSAGRRLENSVAQDRHDEIAAHDARR